MPRIIGKTRFIIETLFSGAIKGFQIRQLHGQFAALRLQTDHVRNQHAELRAPITDVVLANHVMPLER